MLRATENVHAMVWFTPCYGENSLSMACTMEHDGTPWDIHGKPWGIAWIATDGAIARSMDCLTNAEHPIEHPIVDAPRRHTVLSYTSKYMFS